MKKILILLAVVWLGQAGFAQQTSYVKDPYAVTYITNTHRLPDPAKQAQLAASEAWTSFKADHGNWWVEFNEVNGLPHRATGSGIPTFGATVEERAMHFVENELSMFGVANASVSVSDVRNSKYYYIDLRQEYEGLEVMWSRATLRMTKDDYRIIMFGLDIHPGIDIATVPSINAEAAANFAATGIDLELTGTEVLPALKVLPMQTMEATGAETVNSAYSFKLVYEVMVGTKDPEGLPGNYYTLVDAHSGAVYYRQNQVHACGSFIMDATTDVQAEITDNPLVDPVVRGLGYIRVEVDGDFYYADENGILNLDFITEPTPATIDLRGLWSRVSEGTGTTNIESIEVELVPGDNLIAFDDLSGATPSEVSAYYHQNLVHDHMKSLFPAFDGLDIDQLIRVERNDGSCNAFYDGSSTNFYQSGGGCPATALFRDVVYHEYGHGINYDLYAGLGDPGGMNNGAMQEGYADVWGFTITEDPILGQGFSGGAATYVRRYDLAPKVYPDDLIGQVHNDGEIIAGAWWDLAENLGDDVGAMTAIWAETINATSDGPNGDEGAIYREILLEALLADDDDGDLGTGTPNDLAIIEAFAEHGITLLATTVVEHSESLEAMVPDETITIEADMFVDFPVYLGDFTMFYRTAPGATWTPTLMSEVSGTLYSADIPAQPAGTIIEYYFVVTDIYGGVAVTKPKEASAASDPNLPYFSLVGYTVQETEDFDNTFGDWAIDPFGTDEATTGIWTVDDPIQTEDGSYINQPGFDNTPGPSALCAFTGNAPAADGLGANDVDGGATSLQSPFFDASIYDDTVFTYYRWFANDAPTSANPGNDAWQVFITNNGTDWVRVERTFTSDNSWRRNAVRISDYVTPSEEVALLFVAQDSVIPSAELTGGSLVEAAIDDLQLWGVGEEEEPVDTTGGNFVQELGALQAIYPNPANEQIILSAGNDIANGMLIIYNQIGQTVWQEQIVAMANDQVAISVAALPEGVYTLVVEEDGRSDRTQLIIQR